MRSYLHYIILILSLSFSLIVQAYSGGSGTEADPYQIATKADLLYLGTNTADYSSHFIMTADIDLAGEVFDRAVIAPDTDSTDENFEGDAFTGSFNGDAHSICDLVIDATSNNNDFLGLFGKLGESALVEKLALTDVVITGGVSSVNCGALWGYGTEAVVRNCWSSGVVSGYEYIGGLCGSSARGVVSNCYSIASVICAYGFGGGFVGGLSYADTIENCYSTGPVSGASYFVGGFCGFKGRGCGTPGCFWDMETSGMSTSFGGTGKSTEDMQTVLTFSDAGWDLVNTWRMADYPVLQCFNSSVGDDGLSAISISGPVELFEDSCAGYTCVAGFSDGRSSNVTASASWSVDRDFAEISSNGLLSALGVDTNETVIITASYTENGITKTDLHAVQVIDIPPVVLSSISVSGPTEINENSSVNCSCVATYSDGSSSNATEQVEWSVDSTFAEILSYGLLTAKSVNTDQSVVVSAIYTMEDVTKTNALSVVIRDASAATLSSILISGPGQLTESSSSNYTCLAFFSDGSSSDVTTHVSWSEDSEYAQISLIGLMTVTGVDADQLVTVSASYTVGGVTQADTYDMIIRNAPVVTLYSGGSGTTADPYQIASAADLIYLGTHSGHYDKAFVLTADIDLAGHYFDRAVIAPDQDSDEAGYQGTGFSGTFNGDGYIIKNLTISITDCDYLGLFGCISGASAMVSNLGVVDVSISGSTAADKVGGLCGANYLNSTIRNCYVTGSVSGCNGIGGFCGMNTVSTLIKNCYSSCSVEGDALSGGFCGINSATTVISCFWDTELSGMSTSACGLGRSTAQMMNQQTFINAGWDFVMESANGGADLWYMDGYPVMNYEGSGLSFNMLTVVNGSGSAYEPAGNVVSIEADSPEVGYEFISWSSVPAYCIGQVSSPTSSVSCFVMPETNVILTPVYTIKYYDVSFDLGEHGGRIGGGELFQSIKHGCSAVEPDVQVNEGWRFTGWDIAFHSVTNNIYVTAVYKPLMTGIEISGPSSVVENSSANFVCTVIYSDGSHSNVTSVAVWSENSVYADVNSNGLFAAYNVHSDQEVILMASFTDGGFTKTNTLSVIVKDDPPGFDIVDVDLLLFNQDGSFSTRKQPVVVEDVHVEARVANEVNSPSDIMMYVSYYVGDDVWGTNNWMNSPSVVTRRMLPVDGAPGLYRTVDDDGGLGIPEGRIGGIAGQQENKVVQYLVWAVHNGESPLYEYQSSFENPSWYYPVDYNSERADEGWSPYYIVYGAPPGAVWVNEINVADLIYGDGFVVQHGVWENAYIEIAVPAMVDLGGWKIDLVTQSDYVTQSIEIPYGLPQQVAVTNGYAFFVIADTFVPFPGMTPELPKVDLGYSGLGWVMPSRSPGGIRLRRPRGMYEQAIAYDDARYKESGPYYDGTVWAANDPEGKFVYVGEEQNEGSLSRIGIGDSTNTWVYPLFPEWDQDHENFALNYTPGLPNGQQFLLEGDNLYPGVNNVIVCSTLNQAKASHNGERTLSYKMVVPKGESANIEYEADDWYRLVSITVDGVEQLPADSELRYYCWTLDNIQADVELLATINLYKNLAEYQSYSGVMNWLFSLEEGDALIPMRNNGRDLSLTEQYWLNADPSVTNQFLCAIRDFSFDVQTNLHLRLEMSLNGNSLTNLQGGAVLKLQAKNTLSDSEWNMILQYYLSEESFDSNNQCQVVISNQILQIVLYDYDFRDMFFRWVIEMEDPRVFSYELENQSE